MAPHINELTICSLRGLRNLRLPQLGNVNLFVGDNNSGKTTVLEAISLFCRPLDPLNWVATARGRTIKSSRESRVDAVRWLFPQNDAEPDDPYYKGNVCIAGEGAFPCSEASAHFAGLGADERSNSSGWDDEDEDEESDSPIDGDDEDSLDTDSSVVFGAEVTLSAHVHPEDHRRLQPFELWEDNRFLWRDTPKEPKLNVVTISPFSHRVEQLQVTQLTDTILADQEFSILECVRLIDPEIASLKILSRRGIRPTLWLRRKGTGYSPLYVLGDGFRRVLTIALGLVRSQNGVLLIDEIETAIHKDALVEVFQWLVEAAAHYNVQLFATTHSLEAVDALVASKEHRDEIVTYRLPPPGSGRPSAHFPGQVLYEMRYEGGKEIR